MSFQSTKIIELGSCAFRQWRAESHCKYIHGYRLIAKFWFSAKELDHRNWVVDFGGLKELKNLLEKQFDHTLCVAKDDPLLEQFQKLNEVGACDLRIMDGGVGIEKTAEWCFNTANTYIKQSTNERCWVEKVEVWEHEKNSAIYSYADTLKPAKKVNAEQYEFNFKNTNTASNAANVVAAPAPEIQEAINNSNSAPVGNHVTTGWGNPFGGTSWGS